MRSRSLLSFLLVSASLPVLAATSNDPLSMQDWHVAPMMAAGDANPTYCAMATHYSKGPVVTFTRNAAGKGSIAVDFANAELQKGKRYGVSLKTGGTTKRFTATAISATQLVLQVGMDPSLNRTLAAGDPLTVTLDGTDGTYTLAGNSRAFFEFDHCLKALGPAASSTMMASNDTVVTPQPLSEEIAQVAKVENPPVIATPLPIQTAAAAPAPLAVVPMPAPPVVMAAVPVMPAPQILAPAMPPLVVASAPVIPPQAPYYHQPIVPAAAPVSTYTQPPLRKNAYTQPIVPQHIVPVATAQQPQLAMAAPLPPELSVPPVPFSDTILWDATTTAALPAKNDYASIAQVPVIKQPKEIAPVESVVAEPVVTQPPITIQEPARIIPIVEETKPDISAPTLARTIPAAGLEETQPETTVVAAYDATPDATKSRLKSSLAQARAEAADKAAEEAPMPIVKAVEPTPAPIITPPAPKKVAAPVYQPPQETKSSAIFDSTNAQPAPIKTPKATPVYEPIASPTAVIAPPMMNAAPIVASEPAAVQAPSAHHSAERVPLASAHANPSNESELQNLLFDNSPTLPGTGKKSYTTKVTTPAEPLFAAPAPVVKTEPVKQEIIQPVAPPVAKQETPVQTPRYDEANEATSPMQDVIPSLPPILPAASAPTLAVEKETTTRIAEAEKPVYAPAPVMPPVIAAAPAPKAVPSQLNTVTPSVGHPAPAPYTQRTQIQTAATKRRVVTFTPSPASETGAWSSREVGASAKDSADGFCLLENSFDNDTKLMIGQRPDGYSTLGLNYGIDMLAAGKSYRVTVKIDDQFDEDFTGYAESSRTLIVQMGKKRSFFDTLPAANAINVAMPGVGSTFALQNLSSELDAFSACIVNMGGSPLNPATAFIPTPINNAIVPNDPVETTSLDMPKDTIRAVPTPIAEEPVKKSGMTLEKYETSEQNYNPVKKALMPPVKERVTQHVLWDEPQLAQSQPAEDTHVSTLDAMPEMKTEAKKEIPNKAVSAPVIAAADTTAVKQIAGDQWPQQIRQFLMQSGVASTVSVDSATATWSDGSLKGTAVAFGQTDILDAADAALVQAEKSCQGNFTSQMGVPETFGSTTAQPMESKCTAQDGSIEVSTWLVRQQENGPVTAVQMAAPRDSRGRAFKLRDKMLSVLKKSGTTTSAATPNQQDKSS